MATLTRTPSKRNLGIETLESRLNLSTLTSLATPVAPQTTGLSSITNTTTTSASKLITVDSASTTTGILAGDPSDPLRNVKLGDTSVPTTGSTSVNVYDYSSITNASMNWSSPANVGNMAASGVNIQYKLNTSSAGTYRIEFDVAAVRWGSFDLYVNGTLKGSYSFLSTGSWNSYAPALQDIALGAGANTISITPTWGTQFNLSAIKVTPMSLTSSSTTTSTSTSSTSTSSTSSAGTLGSSLTLSANQYSALSNAVLENQNTTPDIGGMGTNGAYVEYTFNVSTAGTYNLSANASANSWAAMGVSVNGGANTEIDMNGTGGWSSYKPVSGQVYLPAGTVKLRFSNLYGTQFNLQSVTLTSTASTSSSTTSTSSSSTTNYVGSSATVTADKYSAISGATLESQGGTADIGSMSTSGAYAEYTLNVTTAGTYNLSANVAANSWAAMGVSINGGAVTEVDMNATGGWSSFAAKSTQVYLPAGTVKIRFSNLYGTQYNLGTFTLTAASTTSSTTSTSSTSSSSTNYVGTSATVTADKYSAISNAKLETQNGTADIGSMSTSGAYVEYTLNVATAGTYTLSANVAANSWAAMGVSVNGGTNTEVDMNSTGGWASFTGKTTQVYLPAGTVKLRFSNLYGTQFNLGTFTLTAGSSSSSSSSSSSTTTTTTPQQPASWSSGSVNVTQDWMTSFTQLTITGTSGNDSIYVSQSGNTITVTANGSTKTYSGSFGNIVVKGGDGNDTITIDSSVTDITLIYGGAGNDTLKNFSTTKGTIVAVGGGYDVLQGNGWNTSYWADSSDTVNASASEYNGGRVHQVSSFWNGVSTELNGQNLSDPSGTGSTTRLTSSSFWGTGAQITDITQGQLADCFLVGALQTLANNSADQLREMAVDLGDGTYAIAFKQNGATTYVRVDGDLAAGGPYGGGLMYAHPGPSGNQWAEIFEKAYAEIGTGAWNYSSLNYGWFGNVFSSLGVATTGVNTGDLYNSIANALNAGKGVTLGTTPSTYGVPLIGDHTYTVVKAWKDQWGTAYVTLRNPWGYDGAGSDSNTYDGYVTVSVSAMAPYLIGGSIT